MLPLCSSTDQLDLVDNTRYLNHDSHLVSTIVTIEEKTAHGIHECMFSTLFFSPTSINQYIMLIIAQVSLGVISTVFAEDSKHPWLSPPSTRTLSPSRRRQYAQIDGVRI